MSAHIRALEEDEEARVHAFSDLERRRTGAYFTPAPLVRFVLERAFRQVSPGASVTVIDPACGAGAFLAGARAILPGAALFGLELDPQVANSARARLPEAHITTGDALDGGFEPLLAALPEGGTELWVGNPPYNGTSPLLERKEAYARLRALLPPRFALPQGTSLRDDFAFFLLLAAARVSQRDGVLAFLTPSTLLDGFLYSPVRAALLETLALREAIDLGPGRFQHARVSTCLTVWRTRPPRRSAAQSAYETQSAQSAHEARDEPGNHPIARVIAGPIPSGTDAGGDVTCFTPTPPSFVLRAAIPEAQALDASWREKGEPLTTLIPVSFPGLKTRFDELLVDTDPDRLLARVAAFLQTAPDGLAQFAERHGLESRVLPKLAALKAFVPPDTVAAADRIRPFVRYAGARHRNTVPESAWAYCYLDRRLIPRGDHRLRQLGGGREYDPHAEPIKLVFNVRERPLSAALITAPGCVHAHRHSRFAPLFVPRALLRNLERGEGRGVDQIDPEDLVPNLSTRGLELAEHLGGPRLLFEAIVRFINGTAVQSIWAPAFAAHAVLPVPLEDAAFR